MDVAQHIRIGVAWADLIITNILNASPIITLVVIFVAAGIFYLRE